MKIGSREFEFDKHTYVMGILNVTPDSFSDGGKWNDTDTALFHVKQMLSEGADIIDVGGESTRPGYTMLSDEEEIERTAPVIERIRKEFDAPVSIDTYKSRVAGAALSAGADMVNDIWGLKYDDKMAGVIAGAGAACCLMHNRHNTDYTDFVRNVLDDMKESLKLAAAAGIGMDRILTDPGVGFAKTREQNLMIMRNLTELRKACGCPVLLAASRKSVIGLTLNLPVNERLEGTLATTAWGVMNRAAMVRVHDVKENVRLIQMLEAIRG